MPRPDLKIDNAGLSEKEKSALVVAWHCSPSKTDTDWNKLASIGGYTNVESVKNLVRGKNILTYLDRAFGNEGQVEGSSTSTPQKRIATKGKRKAAKDASADAPISKKGKTATATAEDEGEGEGEGEDEGEDSDSGEI
ncbi:hypothetical protein EKO27_g10830 [Xylaria grammica]|uniref:Uncharacterized protein n=1 Tax=Xylaria grammica TaxID=363999 RepID=A0A439CQ37_9PEZI|nr:hypothetical protein EKO27_g10830 [Xylaria grammica]